MNFRQFLKEDGAAAGAAAPSGAGAGASGAPTETTSADIATVPNRLNLVSRPMPKPCKKHKIKNCPNCKLRTDY